MNESNEDMTLKSENTLSLLEMHARNITEQNVLNGRYKDIHIYFYLFAKYKFSSMTY